MIHPFRSFWVSGAASASRSPLEVPNVGEHTWISGEFCSAAGATLLRGVDRETGLFLVSGGFCSEKT